ncbi:MAG: DUF4040 domain-containing protein [Candidatus Methanomethylicus sp.]|nr:DUF4040 domain-containing protein [Candidatus Methanomethylicus sp.]
MPELIYYLIAALILIFAVIAVEVRDLVRMAISFSIMSLLVAVAFYLMDAPYVSVFQLAINAGAITVLFLALLHILKKRRID